MCPNLTQNDVHSWKCLVKKHSFVSGRFQHEVSSYVAVISFYSSLALVRPLHWQSPAEALVQNRLPFL